MVTVRVISAPVLALLATSAVLAHKRAEDPRPSFVIMLMDDMGYGDLGVMGEPNRETPHLDRMAAEGMLLPEFYTAAAICSPSRAALLTGRLPIRNGFYSNNDFGHNAYTPQQIVGGIADAEVLLPELLRKAGYRTGLIGKWHLGHRAQYLPLNHGFDTWFGSPNCHFGPYDDEFTPNIPVYRDGRMIGRYYEQVRIDRSSGESNYTRRLTEEAVAFLERQRDSPRPFFLLWTPDASHGPHYASRQFLGTSRRGLYGDAVAELDASVGQIMSALRRLRLHNTLVVFSSDNGAPGIDRGTGGSNGRLLCGKQTTFEGGFRVPTIAWWRERVPPGSVSHQVATQMDLFTTLVELAGQPAPNDRVVDGLSLTSALVNVTSVDRPVFFYRGNLLMAVRVGRHKAHMWTLTTPPSELARGIDHCPGACVANMTTPLLTNRTMLPTVVDLLRDPEERFPLQPGSARYRQAMNDVNAALAVHRAHLVPGKPQLDWCDQAVMNWAPAGCQLINSCLPRPASTPYRCNWPH